MLINFVDEIEARVVGDVIARHGYWSRISGTVLVTDCPALLTIPVVGRAIGLHRVRSLTLGHPLPGDEPPAAPFIGSLREVGQGP